jgi:diguanylate cyclase (GGDEF)-like protein/PAS domain S-box-containing protein
MMATSSPEAVSVSLTPHQDRRMPEVQSGKDQDQQPGGAYDRPAGQDDPTDVARPGARMATNVLVALTSTVALAFWTGFLLYRNFDSWPYATMAILLLFAIASASVPLQFAYKQEMTFEITVTLLAALLMPTDIAITVLLTGYVIGYGLRYSGRFGLDCPYNVSISTLILSATGISFRALGWHFPGDGLSLRKAILAGIVVAGIWLVAKRLMVSIVVALESRQPFRQILRDSTLGMQSAEHAMLGAMVALGILGAIVAQAHSAALLLLLVPAFALWLALRQNVETRHRIEASLATAQRVAGIGSLDWDLTQGDIRWSDILFRILGYAPRAVQPSVDAYVNRVHPDDRARVVAAFQAAAEGRQIGIEHRVALESGAERAFDLKFNAVTGRRGAIKRIVGTVHDVTDRKQLEERLHFQAYHDPLTTLPNRAMFLQRLGQVYDRQHPSRSIALLFLDLDRFKLINDTLGHDAGDQLLKIVATRLESCVRPHDVVARLGGDEFTILLDNVHGDQDAIAVADRIISEINQPMTLLGTRDVVVSTSLGIVRPGPEHTSGADLLRDADTALYRAKELGRNRYAVFDASMGAETRERLALEEDLRSAIQRGQMSLVYQPRIDLATGRVVMVEALVRWTHPTRGEIPPTRFIPIAEETGQIDAIGRWIIRTAVREAATWSRVLNPSPTLSVNITSKQLHDPDFAGGLVTTMMDAGLAPGRLRLEVPESVVMKNVDSAINALGALQQVGVRVAIDDFGTGHSSLASLRRFPVDTLQLDRQFVTEIGLNREATTVAQAVIGLAHGLGLRVVAAGVERQGQVEQLATMGCELAQGNHFCAPVPGPELLAYLIRNQQATAEDRRAADPPNMRRITG